MRPNYDADIPFEVREKMKRNMVYVAIFSIIMVFAGLTSAYIVSMGGAFWVKFPFPSAFLFSTVAIILSSITYAVAIKGAKKLDQKKTQLFMVLTLVLGLTFCFFQFKGYKQLEKQGAFLVSPVTVVDGRYGDYFEVKQGGHFVEIDGNDYLLQGKIMSDAQMKNLQAYFKNFEQIKSNENPTLSNLSTDFVLYFKNEPLQLIDGKFIRPNGNELQPIDYYRLKMLSTNVLAGRGDFFHKGKYGKDFKLYFKGKELQYKDRTLYYQGKKLSVPLQNKLSASRDTATSYLYVLTGLHLLHILGTLIYLIRMVSISFSGNLDENKYLKLKFGGTFWHFLDILWVYLLLFLIFIH